MEGANISNVSTYSIETTNLVILYKLGHILVVDTCIWTKLANLDNNSDIIPG